jgi:hypothetical protein
MQTPKNFTTKITGFLPNRPSEIVLSPYRTKITHIQTSINTSILSFHSKALYYKWFSKLLLSSSFFISSFLFFSSFISPYSSLPKNTSSFLNIQTLSSLNLGCIFTYQMFQPSSKYTLYKEIIEGLQSLSVSIDFYLCKHNQDDYENYITFETCQYKLLKKLDNI